MYGFSADSGSGLDSGDQEGTRRIWPANAAALALHTPHSHLAWWHTAPHSH